MRQTFLILFSLLFLLSSSAVSANRLYADRATKTYVELGGVPYYPGETHICAKATLGMVGGYWKKLGEDLAESVVQMESQNTFEKKRGEIFTQEMTAEARSRGMIALESKKKEDLLAFVNAGFPVIVRLQESAKWRYGVVVGYDLKKRELILRSCEDKREVIPFEKFHKSYEAGGYWKLIAIPASMVPPAVTEGQYLKAIHELEQSNGDDETIQRAYETAFNEWPRSLRVLLSVADFYYEKYQYEQAYELYEEILKLNPKEPEALTKLAETMYYLGEFERALEFIDVMIKKEKKLFKEFDGTRKKIHDSIESGKIILPNGL